MLELDALASQLADVETEVIGDTLVIRPVSRMRPACSG